MDKAASNMIRLAVSFIRALNQIRRVDCLRSS